LMVRGLICRAFLLDARSGTLLGSTQKGDAFTAA